MSNIIQHKVEIHKKATLNTKCQIESRIKIMKNNRDTKMFMQSYLIISDFI